MGTINAGYPWMKEFDIAVIGGGARRKTALLILWLLLIAAFAFLGRRWLDPAAILEHRDQLLALAQSHRWGLAMGFTLIYILATALSFPGASALSLVAGFLFGRWLGTVIVVGAATTGAVLVFWLSRHLLADRVRRRLARHPKARRLLAGFAADAFHYLLFLRLVPAFPFWLVNMAAAFTPISTRTYALATLIGILPGSFVFVNLGRTLGTVRQTSDLVSPSVLLALGLLGLLALIPVLFRHLRSEGHA